ncbi:hypothetical protein GCM10020001_067410 [Nonomuraea salmonea]
MRQRGGRGEPLHHDALVHDHRVVRLVHVRSEIPLTWDPSVEICRAVREGGQRQKPSYGQRLRRLLPEVRHESGAEPAISWGERPLTERDHSPVY